MALAIKVSQLVGMVVKASQNLARFNTISLLDKQRFNARCRAEGSCRGIQTSNIAGRIQPAKGRNTTWLLLLSRQRSSEGLRLWT